MTGVEVLDGGRPPAGPRAVRRRRWLLGTLAVLLVAGLGLAALDARERGRAQGRVEGCGERALAATRRADTVLTAIVGYVAPALSAVPEQGGGRDSYYALVAREAERVRPTLERALAGCRTVEVRSWHDDLHEQQAAYVAHLEARVALVEEVAADGSAYYSADPRRSAELAALREEAFGPLR